MLITSAKSGSARGASRHPAFMDNCTTISCTCKSYLPSGGVHLFVPELIEQNEDAG